MKRTTKVFLLNVIFPLFLGLLIYLFFKHGTYINVIFHYESNIHLGGLLGRIIQSWSTDILWAYSLTCLIFYLSQPFSESPIKYVIFVGEAIFFIFMELLQKFSVINGTFDIIDIITEIFTLFFAVFICKKVISAKK